ncbi:MAG TPA: tyrosine-type recombinase/integrase [Fimbriimonadaceae bacterium]|nr:tyrosine-type recombinase/integrase [Fimbriimonadaceae bacterium]
MLSKTAMPRDKKANLRFNEKTGRWDYRVRLIRPDGSQFLRAGSSVSESAAREKRDAAYREFNNDLGKAKAEKKAKRQEGSDTLKAWIERVLPLIKDDCAPTTFEAYSHSLENHVLPALGHLALENVRSLVITEHLQTLSREHSLGVASQARSALARVMQVATIDGRIPANPVKAVRIGARERKLSRIEKAQGGDIGKRWLTMDEGRTLLAAAAGTAAYWPILLGLRFGLRSGEAMGLTWENVDCDAKVIRIRQQAQYLRGTPRHICPPKSAAGVRDVPIPSDLLTEMKHAKTTANAQGNVWVCLDERGEPQHPKHVTRLIKDAVTRAGFDGSDKKPVPTSHDFRSSYLTWLANHANDGAGVKPHVLMAIAGHTDIDMAMKYYVKADAEDLAVAVNSLKVS